MCPASAKTIISLTSKDITRQLSKKRKREEQKKRCKIRQILPPVVFVSLRVVLQDPNRGCQTHKSTRPLAGSITHRPANPITALLNVLYVTTLGEDT